ncbi:MAG: ABC-2 type transport system ATP-binding protein [Syntrophus sp. SKADARSKE-3]|nr:ABC-2 type transport system ATP-binding protein [Syntrophus sp. SKADARSKE-3]
MIELINLTKRYDRVVAVRDLNLSIRTGEIFGFIGPNGAGKTTTIRMMGGLLLPTAGVIRIDGLVMAEEPVEVKKRIGFIPDRPYLYEKLTGMEFMKFSADMFGIGEKVFQEKAESLLTLFALFEWRDDLIEAYSHGMKQRLIIASALLHDPKVLIVDEPMVGLDPAAVKMVKDIFRCLAADGKTIFMSTHTLSVAENLCDRIGIIHRGAMIALGTMTELKERADLRSGDLEEIFIRLTEEGEGL